MKTVFSIFTLASLACLGWAWPADAQPQPASDDFQVNTFTTAGQSRSAVGMDLDGNFVVTWISEINTTDNALSQDGDEGGIFAQRFDSMANPLGTEFQVNMTTTGPQYFPDILVDQAGNFTIVWESDDGSSDGIFARMYQDNGMPLTDEFLINEATSSSQEDAAIAFVPSGFVTAWTDAGLGGVSLRIATYSLATGMVTLAPVQNIPGDGGGSNPDVDFANDGSFVLVYNDRDSISGFNPGIGGQRFDSSGTPVGTTFRVNTYTTGFQNSPAVAVQPDGDFVVAWADSENGEIRMRRFTADATPLADEQTAAVVDGTYDVRNPSIVANADGSSFMIWETFNEQMPGGDFSASGVAGRLFAENGNPIGPKIRINDDVVSSQRFPALAGDGAGNYVVSWDQSSGQDGDGESIEGRLFGPPLPGSTTTTTTTTTLPGPTTTTTTVTLPPMSCGDSTGDNLLTATDALFALRAALGLTSCDLCLCDADGSGSLTSTDALLILQGAVGFMVTFMCPAC